jgi:hypothetical protein
MANLVFDIARTAMAIRQYQDKPVPEELWAGSSKPAG